jgi:hypothetical protein
MFDELNKYKDNGHFFLRPGDDLKDICNAPSQNGVYVIHSLNRGRIELVFIGCTDTSIEPTGLKGQIILKGKFLQTKIKNEGCDALDIYWYVTKTTKTTDPPKEIELKIMHRHIEVFGTVPRWNK